MLLASLGSELAVPDSRIHNGEEACKAAGRDGHQACYDAVRFRPLGGLTQPLIPWINRPTYQQGRRGAGAPPLLAEDRGVPWVETTSPHFAARHELADEDDVVGVLEQLEATRERLVQLFPQVPDEVAIVIHGSDAALTVAQPYLPLLRRLTAPAARRYLVGWFGRDTVHVLAPRLLQARASNVPGSREMNLLAPSALYTQVVVGASNRRLPPPFRPASLARYLRWAWLGAGAGQHFSGQTAHARPAIARRLREGPSPSFPPGLRDAQLLGGTVLDLLAREEGEAACAALASELPRGGPRQALVSAFHGRSIAHTEATWRAQLGRIAGRP